MRLLAKTILQPSTGTTYISVKDLIEFLDNTKDDDMNPEVRLYVDQIIVALATMRTEVEYR